VNKELPPDIKPEPKEKPEEVHEDTPPEPEPPPEEPVDDFPVDDMDLPAAVEAPSLDPVGSVYMDPLMQVYLEQLKKIIMSNFKPPKDLKVERSAKTTVQFSVDRFGGITGVILKRSSGNKAWDHLSVRAIQISKVPELPPNYRAPSLVLNFNFTPN
jgi:TonB family protein